MQRTPRINNHIKKWCKRSIPFFLLLCFAGILLCVFALQPKSFLLHATHGWDSTLQNKTLRLLSFDDIYLAQQAAQIKQQLDLYLSAHGHYPQNLDDLPMRLSAKNWIYKPLGKNYDLYINPGDP